MFTLVVDGFAVKYTKDEDAEHLISLIRNKYKFKVDWEAKQYIGINLECNYGNREVTLSMKNYVIQALKELGHTAPKRPQYAPSHMKRPDYGQKVQYVKTDETEPMTPTEVTYKEKVTGKFLFYGRAIDNTMLHALNHIASSAKTKYTLLQALKHFLDYAATNPDAKIMYRASDMILQGDSDAAYLVVPEARSRAGGFHYTGNGDGQLTNGPITVLAKIIKHVMKSAAEAEVIALFMNAEELVPLRHCLEEMGHPQPPTPLKTDNSTANGIINRSNYETRTIQILWYEVPMDAQ